MPDKPTFTSIISNQGFRSLWVNQILVQLAYNTLNFALLVWVYKLTHSNLDVALLMVSIYLPAMLFGIFAGVFVDLSDRKKIIILVDLLLAATLILFIFMKGSLILILFNTFMVNTLAQFFMPSESSSIPILVSPRQLFLANSLFSLTLYGSVLIGYSLAGPILNVLGINTIFILGAVLLFIAFILAYTNLPTIKASKVSKKFANLIFPINLWGMTKLALEEGRETIAYIRGKLPVTTSIALLATVQGVVGILAVMMPSYLERILLIHASDASYFVMLPLGLGTVIGAFTIGRVFHHKPKRSIVIPGILGAGILFILIGIAPTIAKLSQLAELPSYLTHPRYFFRAPSLSSFFAVGAFLLGICTVSIVVPCQTVLQENTTEKNRGKIFAVLAVFMTGFSIIPVLLAGIFSEVIGVTAVFIGLGVLITTIGLLTLRPSFFFEERRLPFRVREFLGLGHWGGNVS